MTADTHPHPVAIGGRRRLPRRAATVSLATVAVALAVVAPARDGGATAGTPPSPLRAFARSPLPRHPAPRPPTRAELERAAVVRALHRTPFVSRGGRRGRTVALTFDDGPGPYTAQMLSVLRRRHVPATFFQVGEMVAAYPGAARAVGRRFPVGDHTQSHPPMPQLPRQAQRRQVIATVDRLHAVEHPGRRPNLFRPPYASFNSRTLAIARRQRMLTVLWDVDSADYTLPGTRQIVRNVVSKVRPGSIVLMHDAGGPRAQTAAAVPLIVRALRRRGYRFVTVPRMMLVAPPSRNQKLPPGAGPPR